jgi:hypothetical protein
MLRVWDRDPTWFGLFPYGASGGWEIRIKERTSRDTDLPWSTVQFAIYAGPAFRAETVGDFAPFLALTHIARY